MLKLEARDIQHLDSVLASVTAACDATVWDAEELRHCARHEVQLG